MDIPAASRGRGTVWTIRFHQEKPVKGVVAFRLALDGVDGIRQLAVTVNGQSAGAIGDDHDADNSPLRPANAIRYNIDKGMWQERALIDASLLKQGDNEIRLTVPAGDLQSGVVWDYLRLELDENAKLVVASAQTGQ